MPKLHRLLAAAFAAWCILPSAAQQPQQPVRAPIRGAQSRIMMLRHKAVQDELKLSDDQKKKVMEVFMKTRDKMLELVENGQRDKMQALLKEREKDFTAILTPEQTKRLKQVHLQLLGVWALADPEIAKEFQVTEEQGKKLQELQQKTQKEMDEILEGKGAATRTEAQQKAVELHNSANEKGLQILSAEQRDKWKETIGEPFKGEIPRIPLTGRPNRP
jgi:hypothetical protein